MENFIFCVVIRLVVDGRLAKALTDKIIKPMRFCLYQKTTILSFSLKIHEGALNQLMSKKHTCTTFAQK